MIDAVISKYLESHRRLVIPQLGAFLVKMPDHVVVFSEFMKQDDGVLRDLLIADGMTDVEAAGEINRFVFSVRHNIKHNSSYPVGGVGILSMGPNSTIAFRFDPETKPAEEASAKKPKERKAPKPIVDEAVAEIEEPKKPEEAKPAVKEATQPAKPVATPAETPAEAPLTDHEKEVRKDNIRRIYEQQEIRHEQHEDKDEELQGDPVISTSAKMRPKSYVKGLQYRRPHKTTDAYEYNQPSQGGHIDKFLLIAIIAAVLAVGAIIFGFWVNNQIEEEDAMSCNIEQTLTPAEDAPAEPEDDQVGLTL